MTTRIGAGVTLALAIFALPAFTVSARAAELPEIKTSETSVVVACATPGRLMAFLKNRNGNLDPKYETVAVEYMRHGEALGVRWDYAFFQMLLETGFLTYTGDVKPEQNNFAGLGATGRGVRGESFKDISSGVRAHLEHLLMYAGERIENPVAERTRNIQDWGVLTSWQKSVKGPITYAQLATKWAPGTRRYASDIQTIADRFLGGACQEDDPNPEMVALARGTGISIPSKATAEQQAPAPDTSLAVGASAEPPSTKPPLKGSLSESGVSAAAATTPAVTKPVVTTPAGTTAPATTTDAKAATAAPSVTLLNSAPPAAATDAPASGTTIETAAVAGAAKDAGKIEKQETAEKCRVWTASYGGTKAIIIRATADKTINYTVLDVNEGAEKRESEAYIRAYAKGGETLGEFASQAQALDKAFELCPEG